jgi:hypothetical protein
MPPGINAFIGGADFLDFFQVEEPGTIGEGMQRHDPNGRCVGIQDGEGDHGGASGEIRGRRTRGGGVVAGHGSRSPVA